MARSGAGDGTTGETDACRPCPGHWTCEVAVVMRGKRADSIGARRRESLQNRPMLWTPLGYEKSRERCNTNQEESAMAQQTLIGIDLAKHVFQVCMVTPTGRLKTNTTVARGKLLALMARQPPALIFME